MPDLGQHLAPGGHRLRLQRLGRRRGEDLRGDQPAEEVLQRDQVHHRERPLDVGGKAQRAPVAPILEAVVGVTDAELHRADLESRAIGRLGAHRPRRGSQRCPVAALEGELHLGRSAHFLGQSGADAVLAQQLGLLLRRRRGVEGGLEQHQGPPVVDDLPHDAVDLAQLLQAGGETAGLPLRTLRGDAFPVGVGELGHLDPEGAVGGGAGPPADPEQRARRGLEALLGIPGQEDPDRSQREEGHLPLALHDPDRNRGLAGADVEAARRRRRGDAQRNGRGGRSGVGFEGRGDGLARRGCGGDGGRSGRGRAGRGTGGDEQHRGDDRRPRRGDRQERRHPDSNRGMRVLQTLALPLGDGAGRQGFVGHGAQTGQERHVCAGPR